MLEVEFHLQAEAEMREAASYYEERAAGLGVEFLDDVERGANRIQQFPYSWATYGQDVLRQRFLHGCTHDSVDELGVS